MRLRTHRKSMVRRAYVNNAAPKRSFWSPRMRRDSRSNTKPLIRPFSTKVSNAMEQRLNKRREMSRRQ